MKLDHYSETCKWIRVLIGASLSLSRTLLLILVAGSLAACGRGGGNDGGSTQTAGGNPPPATDSGDPAGNNDSGTNGDDVTAPGNTDPPPVSPPDDSTTPGDGSGGVEPDGDGEPNNTGTDTATPVRLEVRPRDVRIALSGRAQLTALAYDDQGRVIYPHRAHPLTVRWISNDTAIASVDRLGWLSGVRVGRVSVQAQMQVDGHLLTADVSVTVDPEVSLHLLELNPTRLQLGVSAVRSVKILAYNSQLQLVTPPCLSAATVQTDPPYVSASIVADGGVPRLNIIGIQSGTSWITFECGGLVAAPLVVDIGTPSQPPLPAEFTETDAGIRPDLSEVGDTLVLVSQDIKQPQALGHIDTGGGQWVTRVLPEFFAGPTPTRLVADPVAGIGWGCSARNGQLACLRELAEGTWLTHGVASVMQTDSTQALAFDAGISPNGVMWIAYQAAPGQFALAYADEAAREAWAVTSILNADVDAVRLAFAPDLTPRIVVRAVDSVYYGAPSGPGNWQFERIDAASASDVALSVGNDGRARTVYRRGDQIVYAEQQGGGWQTSLMGAVAAEAQTRLGLRLDGNNLARVTWGDSHSEQLRVVTRRFPASLNTNLAWRIETPFSDRHVGPDHVALFDAHYQWLLAYRDPSGGLLELYREPSLPFYAAAAESNSVSAAEVSSPITTMPTLLQAQASNRIISLTWSAVPEATRYNVYWGQADGITFHSNQIADITVPQFDHAGRNNGETYFYAITAEGPFGESALSTEVSATPQLGAPTRLHVSADTDRNILTWDPVPDVSEYRLYWNTSGAPGVFDASFALDGTATQFTHGGITSSTIYYYAIQAADDYSTSPISSEIATLPRPRNLTADAIYQDGSLELTWEAVVGAQSYNLYYSTSPGVSRDTAMRLTGVRSPFSHQELGHLVKYYYRVAAANMDGESALSDEIIATSIINNTPLTWRRVSALSTPRHVLAAVTANGSVYAVGGSDGITTLDTLDVYNPTLDQWESIGKLPRARREHGSVVVNGKLYILGGWHDQATTNTVDVYDLASWTWSQTEPMPVACSNFATAVVGNRIYVIGGWNGQEIALVQQYDVTTRSWTILPDLPLARSHLATAVVGERIIVIGGRLNGQAMNNVDMFDTVIGLWQPLAALPAVRSQLTASVLNGRVYAIGGWNSLAPVNTVDIYDPRHDTWSAGATLPTARNSLASTVLNNKIYTLGGWNGTRHVNTVEVLSTQ